MRATLIKDEDGYSLFLKEKDSTNREFIATTDGMYVKYKLSKQNCDEIFSSIDVESLALSKASFFGGAYRTPEGFSDEQVGYLHGFIEAMELSKDKLFTVEDLNNFIDFVIDEKSKEHEVGVPNKELINCHLSTYFIFRMKDLRKIYIDTFIQSLLQSKEIAVEIEIEKISRHKGRKSVFECKQVKLDEHGCLILKKIR
jgi:hypothetical protein